MWRIAVEVPAPAVPLFEAALAALGPAVSVFELAPGGAWRIEAIGAKPDAGKLGAALALAAAAAGVGEPRARVEKLPDLDWVAENRKSFRPLAVGRFLICPSHERVAPAGRLVIEIDAGAAFGSGHHETTRGCLLALETLAKRRVGSRRRPRAVLDMGTGSGILAIAAVRLWRVPVAAVDVDREAVLTARDNARKNGVGRYLRPRRAEGYRAAKLGRARFDVAVANILQRPLMRMAPALARVLAPGGFAVLSGFLRHQQAAVIAAHRAQGLAVQRSLALGDWVTLTMRRR